MMAELQDLTDLAEDANDESYPSSTASSPRPNTKAPNTSFQKVDGKAQKDTSMVLGQVSYAPAVSTTVVTTTTTTTTTFPPIMMKSPNDPFKLDSKLYPLAAAPTPPQVKRFRFNIGDQSAIFQEADDAVATLAELEQQEQLLEAGGGQIQSVSKTETPYTSAQHCPTPTSQPEGLKKYRTRLLQRSSSRSRMMTSNSEPMSQLPQTSTPLTPSQNEDRTVADSFDNTNAIITPELEDSEFPTIAREVLGAGVRHHGGTGIFTPTPNNASSTQDVFNRRAAVRARPSLLDTSTVQQDGSLPSPCLSPVGPVSDPSETRQYPLDPQNSMLMLQDSGSSASTTGTSLHGYLPSRPPTVQDIPWMVDAFAVMPEQMQNYYMYQLLRRCPKSVLHFIAETVEPVLKRDFLGELPPELAQNILGNLDVRSLCRASQVSRKWRRITDTAEKVWKDLFDAEGFKITDTELRRAISEGWGWQADSQRDGRERNLANPYASQTAAAQHGTSTTSQARTIETPVTPKRNNKRKAPQQPPRGRKQRRTRQNSPSDRVEFDNEAFGRDMAAIDGPYAAADAALAAIPSGQIGLSSLEVLHLQKSLYRRHYQFSQSWIDEIQPKHIAFQAHSLNVITCLQFDSERIVTGSDDTNINVYDTQTGAQKAKLEGHDGGVWALQYVGNQLVSGSTDRNVRVWDMEAGVCTHTFHGHSSTVRCLVILQPEEIGRTAAGSPIIMPKEPIIITGSRDSTLRVWRLPKPNDRPAEGAAFLEDQECPYLIRTLSGHGSSVRAIAARGDTLVSGSYDYSVRVWKISTGATIHRLTGHAQKVYSVVGDWQGKRVISGSMDNMVKIWSLETGNLLFNLEGHTSLVGLLDYQKDRLVSAAADGSLRIWSCDSGVCVKNLVGHGAAITCFQHDSTKIVSGSDRSLKLWDINTGEYVRDLLSDLSGVWQVKFDERRCVAAVQRQGNTYIEVLDFGANRDGVSPARRGRRILVNAAGIEVNESRFNVDDDGDDS